MKFIKLYEMDTTVNLEKENPRKIRDINGVEHDIFVTEGIDGKSFAIVDFYSQEIIVLGNLWIDKYTNWEKVNIVYNAKTTKFDNGEIAKYFYRFHNV